MRMTADDLARRLSRPLVSSDPDTIEVERCTLHEDGRLELAVRVLPRSGAAQSWMLTLPLSPEDLAANDDAFVITVRANLEEWRHVGDREQLPMRARRLQ